MDEVKKIKIKELPQTTTIDNDDIFVESNLLETYKVSANDIAKYVSENDNLTNKYVTKPMIGAANGVAPLDSDKKIGGSYITYGKTSNTAYEGANGKILEENLDNHLTDEDAHGYKSRLDDIYTKNEVDNKFSTLETNIDWKESVETYDDIATTYPDPEKGWTVNTSDTTYRYNGSEWVDIGISAIPKATQSLDGLMVSSDKIKLDNIDENANNYSLPIASDVVLGGVKTGNNITNINGTLNLTKKNVTDALGFTPGNSTSIVAYTIEKDGSTIKLVGDDGSESSVDDSNTTYSDFTGATEDSNGESGLVPTPQISDKNKFLKGDGTFAIPTDTKNTAGSTDTSEKIFLIGTKSQTSAAITHSHDTVYVDTDGDLCSNNEKVSTINHTHNEYVNIVYSDIEPTNQRVGDYWCQDYE